MSELQELLARLAELDEPESLVLTAVLRLDGRVERTLESHYRRLRLALKGRRRLAESLEESIEQAAKLLSRLGNSGTGIVYVCPALDLAEAIKVDIKMRERVVFSSLPHLLPLAEVADDWETFSIVFIDHSRVRLVTVTAGLPETRHTGRVDIKNRVKKGGWSQKRYARNREGEVRHWVKKVVEDLERIIGGNRSERIVILGDKELAPRLAKSLPPHFAERLVGVQAVHQPGELGELLKLALPHYLAAEEREEKSHLTSLEERVMTGGPGTLGEDEVRRMLEQGRVDTLILHPREGDNAREEMHNQLVILAHDFGTEVTLVEEAGILAETDGVGALLRW
jgi:peptide subunit release factor 1 (eRF1)